MCAVEKVVCGCVLHIGAERGGVVCFVDFV